MSEKHEEILAIYKIAVDDIRDAKHQQWRIIQLTLLAIAAIVAIPSIEKCGGKVPGCWLRFLVWFVGMTGIVFVGSFAYSLSRYRKKKRIIRRQLDNAVRNTDKVRLSEKGTIRHWLEKNIIREFQKTGVFAVIFIIFIGFAMHIALSIIK